MNKYSRNDPDREVCSDDFFLDEILYKKYTESKKKKTSTGNPEGSKVNRKFNNGKMKTYTFKVVVTERPTDGFWKGITQNGRTGCDDVKEAITALINEGDLDFTVELTNFELE